jgi:hypothetical protein
VYCRWSMAEVPFLVKNCDTDATNVLERCHGEETMSSLSITFLTCTSWHQQAFIKPPQRMSVQQRPPWAQILSGWHPRCWKVDQHCFHLGLRHRCGSSGFDLHSTDWSLALESYWHVSSNSAPTKIL